MSRGRRKEGKGTEERGGEAYVRGVNNIFVIGCKIFFLGSVLRIAFQVYYVKLRLSNMYCQHIQSV